VLLFTVFRITISYSLLGTESDGVTLTIIFSVMIIKLNNEYNHDDNNIIINY